MTRKEQLLIQGYNALTHYGCQLSADHIGTDRIMMPLSLAPALLVLAPPNGGIDGTLPKLFILSGGFFFVLFWKSRNLRNEKRLHAIWDILRYIEGELGFEAYIKLRQIMNTMQYDNGQWRKRMPGDPKLPAHDFTLKKRFAWFAFTLYGFVSLYVLWKPIALWLER